MNQLQVIQLKQRQGVTFKCKDFDLKKVPSVNLIGKNGRTLKTFLKGLNEQRLVKVTYRDENGVFTERKFLPTHIRQAGTGNTVVTGYCLLRDEYRTFKIPEVAGARITRRVQ